MKASDPAVLARCGAILDEVGIEPDRDLAAEFMQTVVRLAADAPGRGEMRLLLRAFRELRYALKTFKPHRHRRKVSMFGSARTPPTHPDYRLAEEFARLCADAGFMVITGAGPGIMQAGNAGAQHAHTFGLAIKLPFEQATNPAVADEKLVHFRYFFSRKLVFVKETHAIALFPGGFGTHDEGFEVLTLVQTGRCDPLPIVLLERPGGSYWKEWDRFIRTQLLDQGMISPEDTSLYFITHDPREAVAYISRFYSNYQSLRYVHDRLVLRVKHAPTPDELDGLDAEFGDILREGRIELSDTSRAEPPTAPASAPAVPLDAELPRMPCLVLTFNRRSLARLRMLIDRLNSLPSLPPLRESAPEAAEVGANVSDRNVAEIAEEEGIRIAGPEA